MFKVDTFKAVIVALLLSAILSGCSDKKSTSTPQTSIPTVTTAAITSITPTTATCGGHVTSDGGSSVIYRGVCWRTDSIPTYSNFRTFDGAGTGYFVSALAGLSSNTKYYIRAYAMNDVGLGYGSVDSFTTLSQGAVPTVVTAAVTNITSATATCGGNVTSGGGEAVTQRGVCWKTGSTPTYSDSKTFDGTGTGAFVSNLTGLSPNTKYYIRAYAMNTIGPGYGSVDSFTTSTESASDSVIDIDGNVYRTVRIGNQWWMAENLKVTHYSNGDSIFNVISSVMWAGQTSGAFCDYNNDISNVATYGRLYNWYAANDVRKIAPSGWHVASDSEIIVLEMYLGMSADTANSINWRGYGIGSKLKETGTVHWVSNPDGTNESGFTAFPAGFRGYDGDFNGSLHTSAYFWSLSAVDDDDAWGRELGSGYTSINRGSFIKQNGFSIRCVKN